MKGSDPLEHCECLPVSQPCAIPSSASAVNENISNNSGRTTITKVSHSTSSSIRQSISNDRVVEEKRDSSPSCSGRCCCYRIERIVMEDSVAPPVRSDLISRQQLPPELTAENTTVIVAAAPTDDRDTLHVESNLIIRAPLDSPSTHQMTIKGTTVVNGDLTIANVSFTAEDDMVIEGNLILLRAPTVFTTLTAKNLEVKGRIENQGTLIISGKLASQQSIDNINKQSSLATFESGTILRNDGTIDLIKDSATVIENTGVIEELGGRVIRNFGRVTDCQEKCKVTENDEAGRVMTLRGRMVNNRGNVMVIEEEGKLTANRGRVLRNHGTISANSGSVFENLGTIVTNTGSVASNAGKIIAGAGR